MMNGLGCMSWEYWYEYIQGDEGAPRCSLFGAPVAYSLDTVRNDVANVWYDLAYRLEDRNEGRQKQALKQDLEFCLGGA